MQKNTRSLSIYERKRERGEDQEDCLGIEGGERGNVSECNDYNNNNNKENMLI